MKKYILNSLLILTLLCVSWSACAKTAFDYSVFESYEAEEPTIYTFEIDKFDSNWSINSVMRGNESNLALGIGLSGDLDGDSVFILGVVAVLNDNTLKPEKLQFLINDTVYTIEGEEFLQTLGGFSLYGKNGEALLKALASANEFSIRMKVDGTNYDDTFTANESIGYTDSLFIINESIRQNALEKISSDNLAIVESYLTITIQ